jgi:hypothetical protein
MRTVESDLDDQSTPRHAALSHDDIHGSQQSLNLFRTKALPTNLPLRIIMISLPAIAKTGRMACQEAKKWSKSVLSCAWFA